ncbi:MAG: iron(II)-dependent oxidoreductase [Myxococcota bacterium]|jgi:iron(II)-dependent oxidoreductase
MDDLALQLRDARRVSLAFFDATPELLGPTIGTVNPMLWELGHIGFFMEWWCLRRGGEASRLADADGLYDSTRVPHEVRWGLPLPSADATRAYANEVLERTLASPHPYFAELSLYHEDMHCEAFSINRQRHGWAHALPAQPAEDAGPLEGDVEVPGGVHRLGAEREVPFVFDNEKWAHEVQVAPFRIARAPVTQGAYQEFVADGGYRRQSLWSPAGWGWVRARSAERPRYWTADGGVRIFDRTESIRPHRPMVHVSWYEADAFARWAGRRLPTEAEWERACAGATPGNMDWHHGHTVDVAAFPESDSRYGCRQMLGNVWEWTADTFTAFPGFEVDPYEEYSRPWMGFQRVLRGGAWCTRSRLIRPTYRNFYSPVRDDPWAGFRLCASRS